jgi:hypothetical protein
MSPLGRRIYARNRLVASFITAFPAGDLRYIVYVLLD